MTYIDARQYEYRTVPVRYPSAPPGLLYPVPVRYPLTLCLPRSRVDPGLTLASMELSTREGRTFGLADARGASHAWRCRSEVRSDGSADRSWPRRRQKNNLRRQRGRRIRTRDHTSPRLRVLLVGYCGPSAAPGPGLQGLLYSTHRSRKARRSYFPGVPAAGAQAGE